ncbi:MAG: metal ABC transporter permease [Rhodobacteraceae bacterium]|jgi:manganese/iron transport system permease protein|uniref:Manganese/iron transport system permease protein n=1 Tax=Salipiger profundus TaxID=1229727 RepID=A0A1U7DAL9_9RHOB|nr:MULTISPECIES: metal ABC transporter permease [Salipiger]APX25158.1 manganese/iron transport system permease protein [Salipiger profundus]MAB05498.1 metal ABC transporter permease [Paracoccaceae bacterium]GGA15732.1 membrane protein [Salipiger profundus]SFD09409.1 manganese/iron transport system permease protein [Salipiger profundus]
METLLLPLQFPFMQNAFLIVALIAPAAALLSCFLVLKGWALLGDATSHAVLPGVVLAHVAGLPLLLGAFLAGLFCALATGFIKDHSRIKQDTVMGVVFSGMFGFGVVLYTQIETGLHLDHILFGNMLGVGTDDLWTSGLIAGTVALGLVLKWRDVLAHAFDPVQARMIGLPVGVIHYGLLAVLSAVIVAMLSSVGIILAIAYLIAPGAIAFLLTRRFAAMMPVAVLAALIAGIGGVYLSFWLDSAPAPTIVLILTGMVLLALVTQQVRTRRAMQAARP